MFLVRLFQIYRLLNGIDTAIVLYIYQPRVRQSRFSGADFRFFIQIIGNVFQGLYENVWAKQNHYNDNEIFRVFL